MSLFNQYYDHGFVIVRNAVSTTQLKKIDEDALISVQNPTPPYELESELGYPGAPNPNSSAGQTTVRRIQHAYTRHKSWQAWAHDPTLLQTIKALLGDQPISLTQAHHNCLMTKTPIHSSRTGWHQDIRYWSFQSPILINAWLSITEETEKNGCMHVIPGSHTMKWQQHQFDQEQFFREDLPENRDLIKQSRSITTNPGDLLLFDSRLLHSAPQNRSTETKLSLVYTYKLAANKPIQNTRSSSIAEIHFPPTDKTTE